MNTPTEPGWYWLDRLSNDHWAAVHVRIDRFDGALVAMVPMERGGVQVLAMTARPLAGATWGPRLVPPSERLTPSARAARFAADWPRTLEILADHQDHPRQQCGTCMGIGGAPNDLCPDCGGTGTKASENQAEAKQ